LPDLPFANFIGPLLLTCFQVDFGASALTQIPFYLSVALASKSVTFGSEPGAGHSFADGGKTDSP
jgi:hypothetical protein